MSVGTGKSARNSKQNRRNLPENVLAAAQSGTCEPLESKAMRVDDLSQEFESSEGLDFSAGSASP